MPFAVYALIVFLLKSPLRVTYAHSLRTILYIWNTMFLYRWLFAGKPTKTKT